MSHLYTCSQEGCAISFTRNAALAHRLSHNLSMFQVTHRQGAGCGCTVESSGQVHACAGCCELRANDLSEASTAAINCGWVDFLVHCAHHGGFDVTY